MASSAIKTCSKACLPPFLVSLTYPEDVLHPVDLATWPALAIIMVNLPEQLEHRLIIRSFEIADLLNIVLWQSWHVLENSALPYLSLFLLHPLGKGFILVK